jgi:TPR repeat protein
MNAADAAKLLNLPPDAPYAESEARFLELRANLEEKIGRAPTPGLKEKYRATLAEVTAAFETLALLNDTTALPVLGKTGSTVAGLADPAPSRGPSTTSGATSPTTPTPARVAPPKAPAKKKPAQSREFIAVSAIAALVLIVGGWWVLSTRAENEASRRRAEAESQRTTELARAEKQIAEETKLALAAAEKAERERAERRTTQARARLTEQNLALENTLRVERSTERALSDLQSDLSSDRTNADLAKQVKAKAMYLRWLRDRLPDHPVKAAKSLAESAISNRAPEAPALLEKYAEGVEKLKQELKDNQADPEMVATLEEQKKFADKGDAVAMNWVGYAYYNAPGIPHNEALGVEWARKAAAKGSAQSMDLLGNAYHDGRGVEKDEKAAIEWWLKAAQLGHDPAYLSIGLAYVYGSGVNKDVSLGIDWIKRAAAKGNVNAINLLIEFYLGEWEPSGVDGRDEAAALDYLRQAARLGDAAAKQKLQARKLTW